MWERLIVWLLFGVGLSLTPLLIVAIMGWSPSSGMPGLLRLLCNEELLAVALTLGGAAAADVLTRSAGRFRLLKLFMGGVTFLATVFCVALYVIMKTMASHLGPDMTSLMIAYLGIYTILGALVCELLSEV